jgi:predicted nucleic acid-binding protein
VILVDTSVWIRWDRDKDLPEAQELNRLIDEDEVATTGLVIAEVLQGTRSDAHFQRMKLDMEGLHYFEADQEAWQRAAEMSFKLRRVGRATPLSDLIVAAVALENDLEVYAVDEHFTRVAGLRLH